MPVGRSHSELSSYNSQITGGVENAAPLHADIPRTDGTDSDLPSEAVLQEIFAISLRTIFFSSSSVRGLLL
jgi:hypothetical protein